MPMHDWNRVEAGIFHAFHQGWIVALSNLLNKGLLPDDYYALAEQHAAGVGPDVVTLERRPADDDEPAREGPVGDGPRGGTAIARAPQTRFVAESASEFYRRKKSILAIRHVSGDGLVSMLEIVSPGNKSSRKAFQAFLDKCCMLLESKIHLLLVDPFPPTKRDPQGIHAAIWEEVEDDPFRLPPDQPLTLVAYESDLTTRAYIETMAVGEPLPDMPLFLEPDGCVMVPLEETYQTAYAGVPRRWRSVLEGAAG